MTPAQRNELRSVLLETAVYGVLVPGYCLLVFHYWAQPLTRLFHDHRTEYAVAAIVLMVVQGFILEIMARGIIALFSPKRKARQ